MILKYMVFYEKISNIKNVYIESEQLWYYLRDMKNILFSSFPHKLQVNDMKYSLFHLAIREYNIFEEIPIFLIK